ncbi:hypothetical protein [Bacillus cereus group sp. TH152-1LC]|uniref:hypothetical protein n=1 Tax=Bacillus cereus group sp. TH152-1LC TaxID=3018060 RepID=UPI0022DF3612|nr:hypothetical protein [Bacillus cereus group sp. TH152-1LC]MDA1675270.1 hypothetical protein [Bacillus cereus group sp. TH152-1LC]
MQYNEILKDVVESQKLKHLITLTSSQIEAIESLEVSSVQLKNSLMFKKIEIELYLLENLKLAIYKRFSATSEHQFKRESPIQFKYPSGSIGTFRYIASQYFPDLRDSETKTRFQQIDVIIDFLDLVFKEFYVKTKKNDEIAGNLKV